MTFNRTYFIIAILLLLIEILIALFVNDKIVRPYVGDFLVVIMLYCFVKSFTNASVLKVATGVLLFAYFIEFLQWLQISAKLGLSGNKLAHTVLGSYFEWMDMLMYTSGIAVVIIWEKIRLNKVSRK